MSKKGRRSDRKVSEKAFREMHRCISAMRTTGDVDYAAPSKQTQDEMMRFGKWLYKRGDKLTHTLWLRMGASSGGTLAREAGLDTENYRYAIVMLMAIMVMKGIADRGKLADLDQAIDEAKTVHHALAKEMVEKNPELTFDEALEVEFSNPAVRDVMLESGNRVRKEMFG